MALSAELLKRFQRDDVHLSDKLLAARALFIRSDFCYINRKEEFLLDWFVEMLRSEPQNDVWQTLGDCLKSEIMKKLKIVDIKMETKSSLVELLIQSLKTQLNRKSGEDIQNMLLSEEDSLVTDCSILTIDNNVFLHFLRKNIDKYIELSSLILKSAAKNGDAKTFLRCAKTLVCFYEDNPTKTLLKAFFEELLPTIFEAFSLLKKSINSVPSSDPELKALKTYENISILTESTDDVKIELLHLVEVMMFPSVHDQTLRSSLQHLFEGHLRKSLRLRLLGSSFVHHSAASQDEMIKNLYVFVFEAFVHHFKTDFNIIYMFLVTICTLLGYEPRVEKGNGISESLLTKQTISTALNNEAPKKQVRRCSLLILRELVETLKKTTFNLEATINEISFGQWIQALIIEIVSDSSTSSISYSIICSVIQFNPLIIEPIVQNLLKLIILKPKVTQDEKQQYKMFFHEMYTMFVKLHREQSFVECILLPTLKDVIEESRLNDANIPDISTSEVIPEGIDCAFGNSVGMLSGNMCITLFCVLNDTLRQDVVIAIEEGNFDGGHRLFLTVLETLFVPFLGGAMLADQSVIEETCQSFMESLVELRTCLGRLGVALLQHDHCSKSLASFLRLALAAGEMQLLLLAYSPWSTQNSQLQIPQALDAASATGLQCLLFFLSSNQWNDVAQRIKHTGDETCEEIFNALLQQELRTLVLFEDNIENSKEMQSAICDRIIESQRSLRYLQKIEDTVILIPMLSCKKLISVTENIVDCLINEPGSENRDILRNQLLQECTPLVVSLTRVTMQKIGEILSKLKRTHSSATSTLYHHRLLVKTLCDSVRFSDIFCPDKEKKIEEKFLGFAQNLNEALKQFLETDDSETDGIPLDVVSLSNLLSLLQNLPLPFLSLRTKTFVALGILSVILVSNEKLRKHTIKGKGNAKQKQLIAVNNSCREILQGLLDDPNPVSLGSHVDVGLLVRVLHQDGQCPQLLLQRLFKDSLEDPERFENVTEAVWLADGSVEQNVNAYAPLISGFLLALLTKQTSPTSKETSTKLRIMTKKSIKFLGRKISRCIDRRMNSGSITESGIIALLGALSSVLSSDGLKKEKHILEPHSNKFLSCAFAVLQNPKASKDEVSTAQSVADFVVKQQILEREKVGARTFMEVWKSTARPEFIAHLFEHVQTEDISYVVRKLLKRKMLSEDESERDLPNFGLVWGLVNASLSKDRANVVEKEMLSICLVALKMMMKGECRDKIPDFLAFLFNVADRKKIPLPYELADVILTTIELAMQIQPMSTEYLKTVCPIAVKLLWLMFTRYFSLVEERIPAFLQIYHIVMHTIVINSAVELHQKEQEVEELAQCGLHLEKLSYAMGHQYKHFKAVAQHIVANILREIQETAIHWKVKVREKNRY